MSLHNPTSLIIFTFFFFFFIILIQPFTLSHPLPTNINTYGVQRSRFRTLLGFKETPSTSNFTFDCSPSGPCLPCQYSEKSDDKYRCSETGYRIPFKCVKTGDTTKEKGGTNPQNGRSTMEGFHSDVENSTAKQRTLVEDTSNHKGEPQTYVTYRSCIQAVDEEKLSVLGFEVLMLGLLLISGSLVFFRQKQTVAMAGARFQTNSRF